MDDVLPVRPYINMFKAMNSREENVGNYRGHSIFDMGKAKSRTWYVSGFAHVKYATLV